MTFGGHFDIDRKKASLSEISELESLEGFWEDVAHAAKIQREKSIIDETVKIYEELDKLSSDFDVLYDFAKEDQDESLIIEAIDAGDQFFIKFIEAEKKVLLSDEYDANNAIISINAGAGGTESCDWASMLFRMINRWVESKKFTATVLDVQDGDAAGIKSATILVKGNFAYGLMKSETGVHRLVRISPFDSSARRHTSFASIFVTPEVDDDIDIEIHDKDLKIDVYRSGGAGGSRLIPLTPLLELPTSPQALWLPVKMNALSFKIKLRQ